ncbi:hypothetical protein SNEBB_008830 [Seison nebaliae]|nr:hypothetical protein SNEBB_008830 [Seison nebaliae]
MVNNEELSYIYAAMVLTGCDLPVTAEGLKSVLTASGHEVEQFYINAYVEALGHIDIKSLITSVQMNPIPQNSPTEKKKTEVDAKEETVLDQGSDIDDSDEDVMFNIFEEV